MPAPPEVPARIPGVVHTRRCAWQLPATRRGCVHRAKWQISRFMMEFFAVVDLQIAVVSGDIAIETFIAALGANRGPSVHLTTPPTVAGPNWCHQTVGSPTTWQAVTPEHVSDGRSARRRRACGLIAISLHAKS